MQKVSLTKEIMQILKPALPNAKGTIKREIQQGVSELYLTSGKNLYVVARPERNELVYVAVAGRDLKGSASELVNFAYLSGFKSLRFHTFNPSYIQHAFIGLPIELIEIRNSLFSKEHVYRLRF